MEALLVLDALLALALVWVGWRVLFSHDPFTSAVLYIAFGLLMSLAWVRLRAPDIALAEAAIGAGLTGALLIDATGQLKSSRGRETDHLRWLTIASGILLGAVLVFVLTLPGAGGGLRSAVEAALPESGASHPVTAVLLNLRAYDTWLETGVLLLAVLGAYAVHGGAARAGPAQTRDEVGDALVAVIVPVLVLVAGLLLWLGTRAPGGAFQAGAVLGSAAVLLLLLGRWAAPATLTTLHRTVLGAGFAAFLLMALVPPLFGSSVLEIRGTTATWIILLVETAIMISVAAALALLFSAARTSSAGREGERTR